MMAEATPAPFVLSPSKDSLERSREHGPGSRLRSNLCFDKLSTNGVLCD